MRRKRRTASLAFATSVYVWKSSILAGHSTARVRSVAAVQHVPTRRSVSCTICTKVSLMEMYHKGTRRYIRKINKILIRRIGHNAQTQCFYGGFCEEGAAFFPSTRVEEVASSERRGCLSATFIHHQHWLETSSLIDTINACSRHREPDFDLIFEEQMQRSRVCSSKIRSKSG
jgi:hypothetical protein